MMKVAIDGVGISGLDEEGHRKQVIRKIRNENATTDRHVLSASKRLSCLKRLYPRDFSSLEVPKLNGIFYRPELEELERHYADLCLRMKSNRREREKSPPERRFKEELLLKSKKVIFDTVLVGSHWIDLLVVNVRSSSRGRKVMRGLAIEIDGDSHFYEDKMRKDERKGEQLKILGIGTTHIPNWAFNVPPVQYLKAAFKGMKPLDSRERRRLWTRIYAYTLAIHLDDSDFFAIFKLKHNSIQGGADVC